MMYALREAWTWAQLKHKNILPLWGIADYKDLLGLTNASSQLCMISPWSRYGNVEEFFKDYQNEHLKLPLLLDIARGLKHLHSANPPILHGDLKGGNILVAAVSDGLGYRAQLSDFGLSRMALEIDSAMDTTTNTFAGNCRWLAWERVDPQRYGILKSIESMSTASDIFEMMRTFFQILSGKVPYHEKTEPQVLLSISMQENPQRPGEFIRFCPT